jgi:S1-C subfamily serine protease
VTGVEPLSPAHRAGLDENMLIIEVNGIAVADARAFNDEIAKARPGDYVRIYALVPQRGGAVGQYFALQIPEDK